MVKAVGLLDGYLSVGERNLLAVDLLGGLVAAAGQHDQIIRVGHRQAGPYCEASVGLDERRLPFHTGKNVRNHPPGWFTPGVVRGDKYQVGTGFGNGAHEWPLPPISFATASEAQDRPSSSAGAATLE